MTASGTLTSWSNWTAGDVNGLFLIRLRWHGPSRRAGRALPRRAGFQIVDLLWRLLGKRTGVEHAGIDSGIFNRYPLFQVGGSRRGFSLRRFRCFPLTRNSWNQTEAIEIS